MKTKSEMKLKLVKGGWLEQVFKRAHKSKNDWPKWSIKYLPSL